MTDDFDAIIGHAKRIVTASRNIASGAFPNGAILGCAKCRFVQRATTEDCARYLSTGWPTHCGRTMRADLPAAQQEGERERHARLSGPYDQSAWGKTMTAHPVSPQEATRWKGDTIRVGPTSDHCHECGGRNDGYTEVVHRASCSQAPQGKARKARPVEVSEDELPPELRRVSPQEDGAPPDIARFTPSYLQARMIPWETGDYVRFDSHERIIARLTAENAALRERAERAELLLTEFLAADGIANYDSACCWDCGAYKNSGPCESGCLLERSRAALRSPSAAPTPETTK